MNQPSPTLRLFNSLSRQLESFVPTHPGEARVYSCGPTVYNYQHIGNMRAYVFADTLGRVLSYMGFRLTHVVNITDVGHLTSDADAGEDKMEKMASNLGKSAWDIAAYYQADFENDLARLNIRKLAHPKATDYVEQMIEWGRSIADKHCYELESGLYFDTSTIANYGVLARSKTDEGEGRIDGVEGKRHAADFAIWRKTPAGETRQMEWDSPWGRGAPGWHLECSVMSEALLGMPFDIHTGGIDHREIHHPNEIAQNQARCCNDHSGATIWMHNNFLIERSGKMSKSAGEFLRLQLLVDRGFHPLAYRLMCLQAHYRSELEFSWESLASAFTRLKRLLLAALPIRTVQAAALVNDQRLRELVERFDAAVSEDLNTAVALTALDDVLALKKVAAEEKRLVVERFDSVLGLNLLSIDRTELRLRPQSATISATDIEAAMAERREARAAKDFSRSDKIRDYLSDMGVEVMDGDPLGWDWKLQS